MKVIFGIMLCILFYSCKKEKEKKSDDNGRTNPQITSFAIKNNNRYLLNTEVCTKTGCLEIETLEPDEISSAYTVADTVLNIQYQILDKHVYFEKPYIIHFLKHNIITITDDYDPYPSTFEE